MTNLMNVQTPWFIPLWRRIVLVCVCLAWGLAEFLMGNPGWSLLFAALGLYCAYQFFVVFDPKDPASEDKDDT
ncbi:hypothetical protein J4E08_07985 [Sagittula sp. NFXS13]|uniref:hypothetical protein n=1 Tax=Sagittula sp. NFXS13 TaxID=2819095 RepID=UPI0032DFB49B